jgi:hypothetical protein
MKKFFLHFSKKSYNISYSKLYVVPKKYMKKKFVAFIFLIKSNAGSTQLFAEIFDEICKSQKSGYFLVEFFDAYSEYMLDAAYGPILAEVQKTFFW